MNGNRADARACDMLWADERGVLVRMERVDE